MEMGQHVWPEQGCVRPLRHWITFLSALFSLLTEFNCCRLAAWEELAAWANLACRVRERQSSGQTRCRNCHPILILILRRNNFLFPFCHHLVYNETWILYSHLWREERQHSLGLLNIFKKIRRFSAMITKAHICGILYSHSKVYSFKNHSSKIYLKIILSSPSRSHK